MPTIADFTVDRLSQPLAKAPRGQYAIWTAFCRAFETIAWQIASEGDETPGSGGGVGRIAEAFKIQ